MQPKPEFSRQRNIADALAALDKAVTNLVMLDLQRSRCARELRQAQQLLATAAAPHPVSIARIDTKKERPTRTPPQTA